MTTEDYDGFKDEPETSKTKPLTAHPTLPHYYGDVVRKLFLAAGIILLVTMPFLRDKISLTGFSAIIFILILTFFAGATNPLKKWIAFSDTAISVLGFVLFGYDAIRKFEHIFDLLFITNLVLAGIFLFAFYLSTKNYRGSDTYIAKAEKQKMDEAKTEPKQVLRKVETENSLSSDKLSMPLTSEERRKKRFLNPDNLQ